MTPDWLDRILHRGGRLRAGWRIFLYFVLFAALTIVGQIAVSVLPQHPLQWGSLIVTTAAALLAGWIVLSRVDDRPFGALGFHLHRGAPREAILGLALGGLFILAVLGMMLVTGTAGFTPDTGSPADYLFFLGWTLIFFAVAATWEEAIFRGYPFQALVEWIGPWPATLLSAAIFAFLHGQNPNVTPLALVNIFLAGVLLSVTYLKTRSLWFATGVHLGWNWTMASLLDFPVSGLGFETPLYDGVPLGSPWWTGGDFGPEAGLAGTLVLLAGTLWLVRARWLTEHPATRRLDPIVDTRLEGGSF